MGAPEECDLDPDDEEQRKAALGRLREFALAVEAVVEEETSAWATEFRSNLAALEKRLQKKAEERAPGSVKLSVSNADHFDEVVVSVDGEEVQKLTEGTETIVRRLSPGAHTLVVAGRKDGETSTASKVVQVQAGVVTSVSLPIPKNE